MGLCYKSAACPVLLFRIVFFIRKKALYGQACSLWGSLAGGDGGQDIQWIEGHAEVIRRCEPRLGWVLDRSTTG